MRMVIKRPFGYVNCRMKPLIPSNGAILLGCRGKVTRHNDNGTKQMVIVVCTMVEFENPTNPIVTSTQPMLEKLAPSYIENELARLRSSENPLDKGYTHYFSIVRLDNLTTFRSIDL